MKEHWFNILKQESNLQILSWDESHDIYVYIDSDNRLITGTINTIIRTLQRDKIGEFDNDVTLKKEKIERELRELEMKESDDLGIKFAIDKDGWMALVEDDANDIGKEDIEKRYKNVIDHYTSMYEDLSERELLSSLSWKEEGNG